MIIRGASLYSRMAVIFSFMLALAACGGGGGSGDNFYEGGNESSIDITLLDPQGNETEIVTSSAPGTLRVQVRGADSGVVVTASTTIGSIFPSTGTSLTNNDGVATFQLEAGAEKGAGTVTASATTDAGAVDGKLGFQVGEAGLRIGHFDNDGMFIENSIKIEPASTLAAGGNAQLSVVILNADGEKVTTAENVRFNSGCLASGEATANPANPVSTANGEASTLYTASGCSGNDDITASVVGAAAQAFATLSIASPSANAVNFVSADPQLIVLRGTGGENRDETSDVTFKVVDSSGAPLQGITVDFELSTEVGGLALSTESALSDGEGNAVVTVSSGDVATTVRVIANVDDGSGNVVSTASDLLIVTTGLPDQNSISLSVSDTFVVPSGFNTDGVTRTLTVAMADKFNNPVVDGTSAVFTTEYGSIIGSCTTTGGACSVEWRTQSPRYPTLTDDDFVKTIFDGANCPCPYDLGPIRGGRSTIVVRAQGEESFIDRNGNGIMDQEERHLFDNLPEAFLDNNEDGVYTPAIAECAANPGGSLLCISGQEEIFFDYNSNNQYDLNDEPAVYNGLLCPPEGDGIWCSRTLVEVRDSEIVILNEATDWYLSFSSTPASGGNLARIADIYNNPPPGGSTVSAKVESGNCELLTPDSDEAPNTIAYGAYEFEFVLAGWGKYSITVGGTGALEKTWIGSCPQGATDPNDPT